MKVIGEMINEMGKDMKYIQMETYIQVLLDKERQMAKEFILGNLEKYTMVNGFLD